MLYPSLHKDFFMIEQKKMTPARKTSVPVEKEEKTRKNLRYQRDKDREKVRGIFKFYEVPGGSLSFVFRKYKEDPVERFDFIDGQIYTVPLGVAKHLNKSGKYPVHAYKMEEDGKPSRTIGKMVSRYGFQSLEFTDIDGLGDGADESLITQMVEMKP